jgi:hypothetical protein
MKIEDAKSIVKEMARRISPACPEAAAIVYFLLDCGCLALRSVSDDGELMGPIYWFPGRPMPDPETLLLCETCLGDTFPMTDRRVKGGIAWIKPIDDDQRGFILEEFFGPEDLTTESGVEQSFF